jgi:CheY-like chemotaxis protein
MGPPPGCPVVLVVDDEQVVRDVTSLLLEDAGFRVVTAETGAAALVAAEGEPMLDVALIDVMLPDQSGGDVGRELRARRPDLPIVMASGYDELTAADRVGDLPGARYIRKPYAAAELAELLVAAIDAAG